MVKTLLTAAGVLALTVGTPAAQTVMPPVVSPNPRPAIVVPGPMRAGNDGKIYLPFGSGFVPMAEAGANSDITALRNLGGSLGYTAAQAPTNSFLFGSGYVYGSTPAVQPPINYFGLSDQVNAPSGLNDNDFPVTVGGGNAQGLRNAFHTRIGVVAPPNGWSQPAYVAMAHESYVTDSVWGTGRGGPTGAIEGGFGYAGAIWGHVDLARLQNAKNFAGLWGAESDVLVDANSTVKSLYGHQVVTLPGHANHGLYSDTAYSIAAQVIGSAKWTCGFCAGDAVASWPIDARGTIFGAIGRQYSGVETQGALYGLDLRPVTISPGGAALATPGFGVDGGGGVGATSFEMASLGLSGVTIADGGLYQSIPTLTVTPPRAGLAPALAIVTAMVGRQVVAFGSTGRGYAVGDVLSIPGTAATLSVTAVDGFGGISAVTIMTAGTMQAPPANPVASTGGTGSGATFNVSWSVAGGASGAFPAATGRGYAVGDSLTASGGAGTAPVFTVTSVDALGAVTGTALASGGQLSSVAQNPVAASGGTGTGASLSVGYAIATVAVTSPSVGYVRQSPPLISAQGLVAARFVPTLAPSNLPQTIDLTYAGSAASVTNAIKFGAGNAISFCPPLSCIYTPSDSGTPAASFFDHQRASALISAATNDDGHSEEQTLAVITSIGTGYHKLYAASTAYGLGDNIVVGNAVYRAVVAGTTGASSAPPGTRPTAAQGGNYQVSDGTVTWQWINDAAIDAKVGLYVETQVLPGAGQAWNAAFNYHLKTTPLAGMFLPGVEFDYSNDSGQPCNLGVTDCTAIRIALGGSQITEGVQITGNDSGAPSSIWALRINGDRVASQSAIEVDAATPVGLGFGISGIGGASHSIATIQDVTTSPASLALDGNNSLAAIFIGPTVTTNPRAFQVNGTFTSSMFEDNSISPASLNIGGKHSIAGIVEGSTSQNGISLNGNYIGAQIVGNNWKVDPNGTEHAFATVSNYFTKDSSGNQQAGATCTSGLTTAVTVINGIVVKC